jgi:hypothetical protein
MHENQRRPDFFIVGAPKCGTTAMNDYLGRHPHVFMPERKDTTFFGSDLNFLQPRITGQVYQQLFQGANGAERVGETSVWYLYSKKAAAEIKTFSPDASIVVMLRNPVDMLYAQHSEFLYNLNEDITSFEEALEAEEDRKRGMRVPRQAHLVEGLFYRDTANYSEQLQRYFDIFGRNKVHVIIFDDFKKDTARIFCETLAFLDVDSSFQPEFRIINRNKTFRHRPLQKFFIAPPPLLTKVVNKITPYSLQGRFFVKFMKLNTRYIDRPPLSPVIRRRLQAEFQPEVKRLGKLLGRDLSSWCSA